MSLQIGQPAPELEGSAYVNGAIDDKFKLSNYRGKNWLVVFFYPLDFTFVCPTEIKGFDQLYGDFEKEGVKVVGVSVDSAFVHQAWCKSDLGELKFPLFADLNKKGSEAYEVLNPDAGIALRGTFIIDDKGVIRSMTVNDTGTGRSIPETLRTVRALKTGKLTGCDWNPGDATLN